MAIRKYTKKSRKYKRKHKSLKLQKGGNGNNINNGNTRYKQPNSKLDSYRSERQKNLLKKKTLTYDEWLELYPYDRDLYFRGTNFGTSVDNAAFTTVFHRDGIRPV